MKLLNTILAMTALLGWLPPLLCLLAIKVALAYGAMEWPDIIFDAVFMAIYLTFLTVGAYIYTAWFAD